MPRVSMVPIRRFLSPTVPSQPLLVDAASRIGGGAGWLGGLLGVVIGYAPLVWLALHFKAGARELQEP